MLNIEAATELAQARLSELSQAVGKRLVLERAEILDGQRSWAFSYNTERWKETRNPTDGLVGNGPLFVDKFTSQVFQLPSGGFRSWLASYNETGVVPSPVRIGPVS